MVNRRFNPGLAAIVVSVMCILTMIVGVGAIAMQAAKPPLSRIRVPGDFTKIQEAVDAANPGDVIQVDPGIYQGAILLNKPVTLVATNFDALNPLANTTVLDGQGGDSIIFVPAGMSQMPTVRGFIIRNGVNAVQAQSPLVLESNYFETGSMFVNYRDGSGGINRGNIYFHALDDAIHVENASRPLLIENNRILYSGDDGIEVGLQTTPSSSTPTGVDLWNNMIIGSQQDGIQIIDYDPNPQPADRRFVIVGNLIANNLRAGLGLIPNTSGSEDYSAADIPDAIHVYNDTFYGNNVAISGGDNLVAFNNIIANSLSRGAWKVAGPAGSNSVIAYTLFFNNKVDSDQSVLGAGNILGVDPLFAALPNAGPDGAWGTVDDDFSGLLLSASSPAIDKGVTQYIAANGEAVPPTPITGFTGAAPDLGWREFGSAAFVTATPTLVPTMTLQATNTPFTLSPVPSLTPSAMPPTNILPTAIPPSVTAPPAIPTQAPTQPAPTATLAASPTATPSLTITGIVPPSAQSNTTINITVTGSGFLNGAVVNFEGGQGTAPEVTLVQVVNPQTVVLTVNVKADPAFGVQVWDLRLTNPNLSNVVLLDAFTVTPAQP